MPGSAPLHLTANGIRLGPVGWSVAMQSRWHRRAALRSVCHFAFQAAPSPRGALVPSSRLGENACRIPVARSPNGLSAPPKIKINSWIGRNLQEK
ncbi:hypothetical protein NDU88_001696 [Pleurodeles waltl]|uniref:Uncharacterized protein n=1 Tax=Pleurodeles waltl TaxID=8319 RepID=A0AAV7Q3U8_PLEWA|nr:hypothetical protein NDU88_001696 [Pleurodeles waltl]